MIRAMCSKPLSMIVPAFSNRHWIFKASTSAKLVFQWLLGVGFVLWLSGFSAAEAFATVVTRVEPNRVEFGAPFRLTLTQMGGWQTAEAPDLTPLHENFIIEGTERRMSRTVVNGQVRSANEWSVVLVARRVGVLKIPALKIGAEWSTESSVEILGESTAPDAATVQAPDALIQVSVDKNNPFINQQVLYTLKLYNAKQWLDADFQPPRVDEAVLISVGPVRSYQTTHRGRQYQVEEQQYAIFPQKSGELEIIPPTFRAVSFDAIPKRVNIQGEPVKLTVKPKPAHYTGGHWLPAEALSLQEHYDNTATMLPQGTTLTRTLTLETTGIPGQLLPVFTFEKSKDFDVYLEPPEVGNVVRQQEVVGSIAMQITYLLNRAGKVVFPEIKLTWFNTRVGKEEVAVLPAHEIEVQATALAEPVDADTPDLGAQPTHPVESNTHQPTSGAVPGVPLWVWVLVIFLVLGWVVTLLAWRFPFWRHRRNWRVRPKKNTALKSLQEACLAHDPVQAQRALLRWASQRWPMQRILSINELAQHVSDLKFKAALQELAAVLYSQNIQQNWHGEALWHCVKAHCTYFGEKQVGKKQEKSSELPPIHPE